MVEPIAPFADDLAGLACRLARARSVNRFADNLSGNRRILLKKLRQTLVQEGFDRSFDVRIEFSFGLPLKLWLRQLDGNHRHQTFAHIVAAKASF